jgi:hypothetical protein
VFLVIQAIHFSAQVALDSLKFFGRPKLVRHAFGVIVYDFCFTNEVFHILFVHIPCIPVACVLLKVITKIAVWSQQNRSTSSMCGSLCGSLCGHNKIVQHLHCVIQQALVTTGSERRPVHIAVQIIWAITNFDYALQALDAIGGQSAVRLVEALAAVCGAHIVCMCEGITFMSRSV